MSFSFAFGGDDIEDDGSAATVPAPVVPTEPVSGTPSASAFPVQGQPQLAPQRHALSDMLAQLPSKIVYSLLNVTLDADSEDSACVLRLPRRELWDVKVQLMAEAEDEDDAETRAHAETGEIAPGLGAHDVKTGIYEGGFKSWESSVDLVKVLLAPPSDGRADGADEAVEADGADEAVPRLTAVAAPVLQADAPAHVVELGCGTALPSLALFHWACAASDTRTRRAPVAFTVADYNPSVLFLVTLPNLVLAWALQQASRPDGAYTTLLQGAFTVEDAGTADEHGELEVTDAVKAAFMAFLDDAGITLSFVSGGWSPAFLDLVAPAGTAPARTLVLGAETIYSPFALEAFSVTLLALLHRAAEAGAVGVVGAKKLYFGVGGSLDDFVQRMRGAGAAVAEIREEADGVRRGVVQCTL